MENLTILTLIINALVVGLIVWILRKWTSEAKDEADKAIDIAYNEAKKVLDEIRSEIDVTRKELISNLEKEAQRAHDENMTIIQMIEKKLDVTLFEARLDLNKLEHEKFIRDSDRFEKCLLEFKQQLNNVRLSLQKD